MRDDFVATRRWIAGLSGLGAANMAIGSLRQLGVIDHLPDPPLPGFDSDAVVTSKPAFALGVPDAPVAMVSLLANIPLAFLGGPARSRERPWIPIMFAAKAIADVSVAAWYLVQMRTRVHAWCAYCLLGATVSTAIAAFATREGCAALRTPGAKAGGLLGALIIASLAMGAMTVLESRQRASGRSRGTREALLR